MLSRCRSALSTSSRRSLGARGLATPVYTDPAVHNIPHEAVDPPARPKRGAKPTINTGIVLNRAPFLTRDQTTFERAFQAYQGRLRRALHNPVAYDFYFKEGSILETRFRVEEMKREQAAFGPSFGKLDVLDVEKFEAQKLAAAQLAEQEGELEEMMPRVHEADTNKDYKSLDRAGMRNLYLLVKEKDTWRFPQGGLEDKELLHQSAQRNLYAECDQYMDSWIVSRTPMGVHTSSASAPGARPIATFFYKAHIMAGQVRPSNKVSDFMWLAKEEIEPHVDAQYWNGIKDMLSDY
ncbi:50S ribosomal subunit L30 [Cylindrobasidium torrendii FP15055 ss-10]|uniref:Large ribosomal subunit protein mL46 n=1 Tax=Cylindrobasidium torrendii FP15055 ss-10 TaxID=1314674 RepID=A0A0D7B6T9_9AGAR|nr:50S ribosomal subunit L30 [Cylindrobasidium torrendii FP15055 ss-10]